MGDRARLEALLDARLVAGATAPAAAKALFGAGAWRAALGVALAGGATVLALNWQPEPPEAPVSMAPSRRPLAAPGPAVRIPSARPSALPSADVPVDVIAKAAPEPAAGAPRAQDDRLAQEVALLSRATSALRAGRANDALKALEEHKRKFPNGTLVVERRAASARALCSLQRITEGRAELSRLTPQSLAAARAKQVCDAAAAKAERP